MAQEPSRTRLALIHAAGELFAENGFGGTSVRAIAEKGGANIAAINYHFGSKENLYTEVLRFALLHSACARAQDAIENDAWAATPEGQAALIRDIVHERFTSYFSKDRPPWFGRVVMRGMLDPTPSLETVVQQVLIPEHEALREVIQRIKPEIEENAARLWALSLIGQIAFYVFGKFPILKALGKEEYDDAFLEEAAEHAAKTTLNALGLTQ